MAKAEKAEKEPEGAVGVATQLLSLVGKATRDDLAQLDAAIKTKEQELDALKQTRKVLAIALGELVPVGKRKTKPPPRAEGDPPAPRASPSAAEERRAKCARYVLKNGPTAQTALCRLFEIPPGSGTHTFQHAWFHTADGKVDLTAAGREAARA